MRRHPLYFLDALVGTLNALLGVYIIFVSQISRKIGRLEIHRFRQVEGFDGLQQLICHFCRAIYRNICKGDGAASCHGEEAGFCIIKVCVAQLRTRVAL